MGVNYKLALHVFESHKQRGAEKKENVKQTKTLNACSEGHNVLLSKRKLIQP